MINRLVIKNFKSIGEPGVDLELKPLTLLVGPNGSGKSSILEGLALMAQTFNVSAVTQNTPRLRTRIVEEGQGGIPWPSILDLGTNYPSELAHDGDRARKLLLEIYVEEKGYRFLYDPAKDSLSGELLVEGKSEEKRPWDNQCVTFKEIAENVFFISALRGRIHSEVSTFRAGSGITRVDWTGLDGEYLIHFLARQSANSAVWARFEDWARKFGALNLWAGWHQAGALRSLVSDPVLASRHSTHLASSGTRQILTVLANLILLGEGSIFLIEEPEISLHPESQVKVCELFAEVVRKEQKQIIATTHSTFLPLAIGKLVREERLAVKDIAVYEVEKKNLGTVVTRLKLEEKGSIKGWIPSFNKVERELLREWLKTIPKE